VLLATRWSIQQQKNNKMMLTLAKLDYINRRNNVAKILRQNIPDKRELQNERERVGY
jgi:hypothetical protein